MMYKTHLNYHHNNIDKIDAKLYTDNRGDCDVRYNKKCSVYGDTASILY